MPFPCTLTYMKKPVCGDMVKPVELTLGLELGSAIDSLSVSVSHCSTLFFSL